MNDLSVGDIVTVNTDIIDDLFLSDDDAYRRYAIVDIENRFTYVIVLLDTPKPHFQKDKWWMEREEIILHDYKKQLIGLFDL